MVLDALQTASEPLDPSKIKKAIGDAARSLGEEGKKRGQSGTLPLALGLLQAQGRIRRVPVNGRLDQQRFGYLPWQPSPLDKAGLDAEKARTELARRYFSWAGPAALKHFRWFSGLTAALAKKAIEPLDLVPIAGPDGAELLLPADAADEFESFTGPKKPSYALVGLIDGIHLLHRELGRLLDPADAERQSPGGKAGRTLGDEPDPQSPIIVDRGRLVGLWEYDPDASEIVYQSFGKPDAALKAAVSRTEKFVREQLDDVRGGSLDSPKSRAPRITALRSS